MDIGPGDWVQCIKDPPVPPGNRLWATPPEVGSVHQVQEVLRPEDVLADQDDFGMSISLVGQTPQWFPPLRKYSIPVWPLEMFTPLRKGGELIKELMSPVDGVDEDAPERQSVPSIELEECQA